MDVTCTIVWFRRDLRVQDNPALVAAARAGVVVPVFIWAPEEDGQFHPGRVSRWWLKQSLIHLDASLKNLGSPLIVRKSHDALTVLLDIAKQVAATQVFYNHLYDPVSLVRDHRVKQGLAAHKIPVHTFNGDLLYEPWEVYDEDGKAFTTFRDFWDKCMNMPFEPEAPLLSPRRLLGLHECKIDTGKIDDLTLENEFERSSNALLGRTWAPGWSSANKALELFVGGTLRDYATHRKQTDNANTSQLSPHLHFGRSLLANLKSFPWRVDEGSFKAWRQGRTGYPLVDAGMRELWATGWLHNRIRVVVSSFCVKFLQLPWRWGMKYFWDTLLDADLECDVLGWQYISGSLPDGHELDRMENPQTEGYKFDPNGEYVRRWLPELSRLPTEWIHHPWDAPANVLRAAGVELGSNYPLPVVDISSARTQLQRSLADMWEREAASRAAVANGSEEGVGETVEFRGPSGPVAKTDVLRVVIRSSKPACSTASSRRDQLVPCMPTEDHRQAANSIVNWNESLPIDEGEELAERPVYRSSHRGGYLNLHAAVRADVQDNLMVEAANLDNELNSTAESATAAARPLDDSRVAVSVWSQSSSSRPHRQQLEGLVPVVPEVLRNSISRRHLHSVQMVNMEGRASHKTSSLSA